MVIVTTEDKNSVSFDRGGSHFTNRALSDHVSRESVFAL